MLIATSSAGRWASWRRLDRTCPKHVAFAVDVSLKKCLMQTVIKGDAGDILIPRDPANLWMGCRELEIYFMLPCIISGDALQLG